MSPASHDDELNDLEPGKIEGEHADSNSGDNSSEEDSGDEYHQKERPVIGLLDSVLDKIRSGKLDLTNKDHYEDFAAIDGEHLTFDTGDVDQPTVLHIIARKNKNVLPEFDEKMQPLIEFLAKQKDYLTKSNRSGCTSLFFAIEERKKDMVQWMCDAHPDISSVLAITGSQKWNCLHAGIDKKVRFLGLLIDRAAPEALAAKDENGNTPLHLAVEYEKCKRHQLNFIKQMVDKGDRAVQACGPDGDFNKNGLSPYLHHKESVRKALERAREKDKKKAREEVDREKDSRYLTPGTVDKRNKDTVPGQKGGISSSGAPSHLDRQSGTQVDRHTKYRGGNPVHASAPINSPAVPAAPVLLGHDEKKRYSRVPESVTDFKRGESGSKSSSKVDETTVKNVERFLKLHYLRSRSYNGAMEILYGRNTTSDQELYFDLSGNVNTGVITQTGLDNLLSKLKFEDILQYVCIPKISVQIPQPNERAGARGRFTKAKRDEVGKRDLCYIFDHLRKKGVKTILKVFVDDSDSPSHSDEAIVDALKMMDVEVWNWNKTDMCTEVIYKASPNAREVYLYWSGNNAVLRGWSEEGGLKKLRELKTVHIHIQQGLESIAYTQLNVKQFKDRMKKLCPQVNVDPIWPDMRQGPGEANTARTEDQTEHSTKHEWIQCMKDFHKLLVDAERPYKVPKGVAESIEEPIKVALIDDGVDFQDLEYTFIGGRTFCPRDEHQNLNNPYYVSRSGHGTIMAMQIYLMCPQAQFYVLRLEDCSSEDATTLTLTAKSAAKAILAAVSKKVHIISMSWTIDTPENDNERRDLENAIIEAANADILMFCSAMDKGAKQTDTYPSKGTNKIFTIGAANASGASADYVGNLKKIDYTFPGDKVEVDSGPTRIASQKIFDGSSVATALAAGLAALILYCVQVRVLLASGHEKEKARKDFRAIKKYEGMKKAFSAIDTTEESNHKFLKVWEVFGKHVEQKEQKDQEEWIELIADVGKRLCTKIY